MRILYFHNSYQQRGGEDSVVENECRLMMGFGHETAVEIISNDDINSFSSKLKTALEVKYSKKSYALCMEKIKNFRPDIIHVHNFFPKLTPAVYDACRDSGVPVVQSFHNFRIFCANGLFLRKGKICEECLDFGPMRSVKYKCYQGSRLGTAVVANMIQAHQKKKTWQQKIDRIFVSTNFTKQKMQAGGLPEHLMRIKPHVVFSDEQPVFDLKSDRYAIFVGRLSQEKGIKTLINAWKKQDIELRIIGDGPERAWVEKNKSQNVKLLGRLEQNDLIRQFKNAFCNVISSQCYENFPVVLAEAYSYGVPVIASEIGSLGELVVEGETGMLFDVGDEEDLNAKINRLKSDPELSESMRRGSFQYYQDHLSQKIIHDQTLKYYKELIS